jgi:hypothetical protein
MEVCNLEIEETDLIFFLELVISSFPRRWGRPDSERNKSDSSGLFRTIRERLDHQARENVYELATLLMNQCSLVFFDPTVARDNRPEVIDIFATAIGDVVSLASRLNSVYLCLN